MKKKALTGAGFYCQVPEVIPMKDFEQTIETKIDVRKEVGSIDNASLDCDTDDFHSVCSDAFGGADSDRGRLEDCEECEHESSVALDDVFCARCGDGLNWEHVRVCRRCCNNFNFAGLLQHRLSCTRRNAKDFFQCSDCEAGSDAAMKETNAHSKRFVCYTCGEKVRDWLRCQGCRDMLRTGCWQCHKETGCTGRPDYDQSDRGQRESETFNEIQESDRTSHLCRPRCAATETHTHTHTHRVQEVRNPILQ